MHTQGDFLKPNRPVATDGAVYLSVGGSEKASNYPSAAVFYDLEVTCFCVMLPVFLLPLALAVTATPQPPAAPAVARAAVLRPPLPPPFPRALHDEAIGLLMARFDADRDGRLDDAEAAAVRQMAAELFARKKQAILDRYDRNGDGRLDEEEEARLKRDWEREHPGIGRRVRIKMVRLRRAECTELMRRFDANRDGVLDENERRAMHEWVKNHRKNPCSSMPGAEQSARHPAQPASPGARVAGEAERTEPGASDREVPPAPGRGRGHRNWDKLGIPPEAGIVLEHLLLERYDTNKDGILSREEIERALPPRPGATPAGSPAPPPL